MAQYAAGNIFIREGILEKKGQKVSGHTHNFDHVTYCLSGELRIDRIPADETGKAIEGAQPEVIILRAEPGGNFALIKASYLHTLTALTDGVFYQCIYSHRNAEGEVIQSPNGWQWAYI